MRRSIWRSTPANLRQQTVRAAPFDFHKLQLDFWLKNLHGIDLERPGEDWTTRIIIQATPGLVQYDNYRSRCCVGWDRSFEAVTAPEEEPEPNVCNPDSHDDQVRETR